MLDPRVSLHVPRRTYVIDSLLLVTSLSKNLLFPLSMVVEIPTRFVTVIVSPFFVNCHLIPPHPPTSKLKLK